MYIIVVGTDNARLWSITSLVFARPQNQSQNYDSWEADAILIIN
jgi:ribulose bisphosphate carboxylase small subunit